ncbi:alpha/beta fold hydrolase [Chloroflexota bacterium]
MPKITINDGAKLNYRIDDFTPPWVEDKDKDTIFMHHGFARNMKWWTMMVPALSRKYRVLRLDARGCGGESTVPPKVVTWSIERLVEDAVNLLDYLSIREIHWVGEASGGMLGLMFAVTYPERINSLTLISTPWKLADDKMHFRSQGYHDPPTAIEKLGFREWTRRTLSSRFGDLSTEGQQIQDWIIAEFSKTPTRVAATFLRIFQSFDFSNRLAEVKVPILIIRANESQVMTPEEEEKKYQSSVQQQIPNAKIITLRGIGGLNVHLLRPDNCVEEIQSFLETAVQQQS